MPKFNKAKIIEDMNCIACRSENEAIALMKWAAEQGYKWNGGENPATTTLWERYDKLKYYLVKTHGISYTSRPRSNYIVIEYKDILNA